ncbi:MAG: DUF1156 domain-containing protein [Ruminiclostridium sp.]|nr:DUF1156 domain-containing protein [Ruminiclostridium sp.]
MAIKKLIEVALPLEKINAESAREKSIRHGHPSTLHLWWARRPLAAARAVIWSSLVDDPSSHPEEFPTEEEQNKERDRLFGILEQLVVWENSNNAEVLAKAKAEIMKSTGGNPPPLLDPFAGGGAIPLEAQRLGLEAHAHDLNPVAVMINKAMIEIPPRFADKPPVNPRDSAQQSVGAWSGTKGLAADVRYYGEWMRDEAFRRIGHLYPKVKVPDDQGGGEATVIAWIWARTVKCPNPACGCQMPLLRSFDLSTKAGKQAHIEADANGDHFIYTVKSGKSKANGTVDRSGAKCLKCGEPVEFDYIRNEAKESRMKADLMAVVAEGEKGRLYISPDHEQLSVAQVDEPENALQTNLPDKALGFRVQLYGMVQHKQLFTNRQLTALTTFSELVSEAQAKAEQDAIKAGLPDDNIPIAEGGTGAKAYGEAIGVYLAFVVDKMTDYHSSICSWHTSGEKMRNTFGRQAIPMVWDYAEGNPFCLSSGSFANMLEWVEKCILQFPQAAYNGEVRQFDAQSDCELRGIMVSTDPPYYDNIGYADLSDYFYVWLRQCLKNTYPKVFRTMLVPKAEELIATPYRHEGSVKKAQEFFEDGMFHTCQQIYKYAREDIPVTIYYAYKQSDTDSEKNQTASTGWETMLSAIIKAGFTITGTLPMRTEMANRSIASGTNALASSIVLVCRKRPEDASSVTRRNFINELKRDLKPALQKLQSSNIAPVDLAQSAIGPGMAVFSKYKSVLEADGTEMTIRTALQIINQELDLYFNEQDTALDKDSRFCVDLYTQFAFNDVKFGDADTLARAKNTSVDTLKNTGVVFAEKGVVRLLGRDEINETKNENILWLLTQQMTREFENGGIQKCADFILTASDGACEQAKALAYRLFTIADRKGWNAEAYAYNNLVTSWAAIKEAATRLGGSAQQITFDD